MLKASRAVGRFAVLVLLVHVTLYIQPPVSADPPRTGASSTRMFPTFSSPRHLYVLNTNEVNKTFHPTIATLQGIVNRNEPRIYVIWEWWKGATDWAWLRNTIFPKGVSYNVTDLKELISTFSDELSGYIIYDPNVPHTVNIATIMAGILNATVAHPEVAPYLESLGLPMIANLTGRWSPNDNIEMYQWAFDTFWENCSHRVLGSLKPSISHLRDYLVACRAFTFFLDPRIDNETKFLDYVLSQVDINTPVLGWFPESAEAEAVSLVSRKGCFVLAADWAPNLSVHSAMNESLSLSQERATPATVVLEDKVYVTFVVSDGDNVQYDFNFMRRPLWHDGARGTIPIGWTISPLLAELAPAVVEWYYENASENDYFVAGPSGMGYIYPSLYPNLTTFTEVSTRYMRFLDLTEVWILNLGNEGDESTVKQMMEELNLTGLFEGYQSERSQSSCGSFARLGGKLYIRPLVGIRVWEESSETEKVKDVMNAINGCAANETRPYFVFVAVNAWHSSPSLIQDVASSLGIEFEVVRPDEFIALITRDNLCLRTLDWSGSVLSSCNVSITDMDRTALTKKSDINGWANFSVNDGQYLVEVRYKGTIVNQTSVFVSGFFNEMNLTCCVYNLTVQIKDLLGLPVSGADVKVLFESGRLLASEETDAQGEVLFPQLPKGEYDIEVTFLGLKSQSAVSLTMKKTEELAVIFSYTTVGILMGVLILVALVVVVRKRF